MVIPQAQFLDWVVVFFDVINIPIVAQRLFPYGPSVLQTIGRPQLQAIDKVATSILCRLLQSTGAVRVEVCIHFAAWSGILECTVVDSCVQLVLVPETLQPVEIPQAQFCDMVFMPWCIHRRSSWTRCSCPWTAERACSQLQLRSPS